MHHILTTFDCGPLSANICTPVIACAYARVIDKMRQEDFDGRNAGNITWMCDLHMWAKGRSHEEKSLEDVVHVLQVGGQIRTQ